MGGLPTIQSYVNKAKRDVRAELIAPLPRPHFEFLSRCESYFETKDFVASHAGVNPACPESRELAEICACLHPSLFHEAVKLLVVCGHYLQTTQAPLVGGSVICLNTGCGTIAGLATALLFPEMTFLQRKGGTKGIKQEVKGGKQHRHCVLWEFGTNSVQLRERKNGPLAPKRHQMKHLDFLILLLESRRSISVSSLPTVRARA